MFYPRYLKSKLLKFIKASPITLLTGGRQTGKTTLVKEFADSEGYQYISFDNLRYLASARQDPMGFLDQYSSPLIIDEIQRVPELALPLKLKVDENRRPGMFILTGSSNPLVAPKLNDSLAGRMFLSHLWPLSQSEMQETRSDFLEQLFNLDTIFESNYSSCPRDKLITMLLKGGFPTVQTLDTEMSEEWFNSHITTLLERDIPDLAQIKKIDELPLLLQLLGNRSSNLLNVSEISRAVRIPYSTLSWYLTLLEALFLIIRQPPWHKNATKKLTKSPKIYMTDSAMMGFLIGANKERLLSEPTLLGYLLKTFVVSEFMKLISFDSHRLSSYHYRTASGIEVDLMLENKAGEVVGIEIKSHEGIKSSDFKGLKHLQNELGSNFVRGIVLYPGKEVVPFGPKLHALPLSALWT